MLVIKHWIRYIIAFVVVASIMCGHVPSPHGFACPPKKLPGGMGEIMKCASKFKYMLDQICKPKYGIHSDLIQNLLKHVFFHCVKCIDEDYEHFLVDGAVECFIGDNAPGPKMLCDVKRSICNGGMQGEMVACAMKEAKIHSIDMAKMMSMLGHLAKLCNILADGSHRECKKKWPDFPPLPIK